VWQGRPVRLWVQRWREDGRASAEQLALLRVAARDVASVQIRSRVEARRDLETNQRQLGAGSTLYNTPIYLSISISVSISISMNIYLYLSIYLYLYIYIYIYMCVCIYIHTHTHTHTHTHIYIYIYIYIYTYIYTCIYNEWRRETSPPSK